MICPVCRQDMLVVEYKDIELDHCPECKGVWFDTGELDLLLEASGLEAPAFLDDILAAAEASSGEKKRRCPICYRKMKKVFVDESDKVLVDVCRTEHGIWFDGGEVNQLMTILQGESPPKTGTGQDVVNFLAEVFKPLT